MIAYSFLLMLLQSKPPPLPPMERKSSIPPQLPKSTHILYVLSSKSKCRFDNNHFSIYLNKYGRKNAKLEEKNLTIDFRL